MYVYRASSEAPRSSQFRSEDTADWLSTGPVYRQYTARHRAEELGGGEPVDLGYSRVSARPPPPGQPARGGYHPPASPYSRLYVRRGSLQSYVSCETAAAAGGGGGGGSGGDGDAPRAASGRSFNSRFLSRVREKRAALGETPASSSPAAVDRPFRSRFLKSSTSVGSTGTGYSSYSSPRSAAASYDSDDN